jgi:hypothetical protein
VVLSDGGGGGCAAGGRAQRAFSATATWRARPPVRSRIARVNGPGPEPSSTTTGVPVTGGGSAIAAARACGLGVTEAVGRGSRANSRTNRPVSTRAEITDVTVALGLPSPGSRHLRSQVTTVT